MLFGHRIRLLRPRISRTRRVSPGVGLVEALEERRLLTTYYFDSVAGNDRNNGTTAPWKSLDKFNATTFHAGDTVLFKAGEAWSGQLKPRGTGTSDAWITVGMYGDGAKPLFLGVDRQATLFYSSDQWNGMMQYWSFQDLAFRGGGCAVEILNGSATEMRGVRLERLDISQMGTMGFTNQTNGAIWVFGWAGPISDVTIADNTITDVGGEGIWVQGANNSTSPLSTGVSVTGNYIDRSAFGAIEVDYSVNPYIGRNTIYNVGANGPEGEAPEVIYIGLFLLMCNGGTIEYNEVAYTAASKNGDSQAFDLDNGCSGTFYFQYNYSHDNAGGFMETTYTSLLGAPGDLCVVRYNISRNDGIGMSPSEGAGLFRIMGKNLLVYNNTFYNEFEALNIQMWWWWGSPVDLNVKFYNNIFLSPFGTISQINTQGAQSNPFFFDHNLFTGTAAPPGASNSILADPILALPGQSWDGLDIVGSFYQPGTGSPAVGAGVPIANNGGQDIRGNPINAAPTLGAIETTGPSIAIPPTAIVAATGKTASLSTLGGSAYGEPSLTYTWSITALPAQETPKPTFSANGTNAAKNSVVTFYQTGNYRFLLTIQDVSGRTVVKALDVTVGQVLTKVVVATIPGPVVQGQTAQLTATAFDQFDVGMTSQPAFDWTASVGAVDASGLFTATVVGPVIVTASVGSLTASTSFSVVAPPTAVGSPAATYAGGDAITQGGWIGAYGADGYDVAGTSPSLPSYAAVSMSGQSNYTWASSTSDPRALQKADGSDGVAAAWYSGSDFTIDVDLTDGQTHRVSLYMADWDSSIRSQRIDVLDAATGALLDSRTVSSFHDGLYLQWNVSGHVLFRVVRLGAANAVVQGLFFDSAPASATYAGSDAITQGGWIGAYGADGYDVAGTSPSLPSYAAVSMSGQSDYTWASSTSDPRALQKADGSDGVAAAWYSGSDFTIDVDLTDGQTHRVSLYMADWDSSIRSQRIDVLDAATGALLDSRTVSSFHDGLYLQWNVSGHVLFRVVRLGAANAVVQGLFFDSAPGSSTTASGY
ncbi:right-handed parallel beta-helix repeat-containing protein [Paludisphaera rhizosphaerae]|uniref:right-handed parallel beta-helix repeat-containing protein n=1 Tax=Paludisphaera rhizosphaerae TaxID=2711216 RepID=UPI0013EABC89|nr:right-handed parallel beta-helix repeat-containing protein [Paludisphaera rhizosphaerae]